ncbi:putative P450 monooxygenase [Xylogone sp. PMI_703]|nr:putative P450 monooxygenase [Xylogone sp. PMI_703]
MAKTFPSPWLSSLVCVVIYILAETLFPQHIPKIRLTAVFFISISITFTLWVIWNVLIYPVLFSPLRHIPSAKGALPIIGHGPMTFKRPSGDQYLQMLKEIPDQSIIRIQGIFGADAVLLAHPQSLAEVLVHKSYDFEKPTEIRNFLRIVLGDGLIIVEGDEHKFQRKHLTPAFSFRHIKELYPIFWSKATELMHCISAEIYENPAPLNVKEPSKERGPGKLQGIVEVNHWANKVTMDIIGVAGLGRQFNALHNANDDLIKNYEELLEPTTEKAVYFTMNLIFTRRLVSMLPWKLNEVLKTTTTTLRGICGQLIRDKKQLSKAQPEEHIDILSLLIKSNNFADKMLVDQLLTFLAAGHETTSSAFTWGTYLLAKHPEIQTNLRDEIRAALPSPSSALPKDFELSRILESLPLLNGVCNEILRLYPPVPVTVRTACRDTTINGLPIPAGTRAYICPWAINRSPTLWGPNADEFVPGRWIDADGKGNNSGGVDSNYAILTFLHGPRSCIGEKFAKAELKTLLAVFCGSFEMKLLEGEGPPIPAGVVTAKPKNGMRLRLKVLGEW